jgi:hypothetical protein
VGVPELDQGVQRGVEFILAEQTLLIALDDEKGRDITPGEATPDWRRVVAGPRTPRPSRCRPAASSSPSMAGVHIEHPLPGLERQLLGGAAHADAGVAERQMKPSPFGIHFADRS